MQGAKGSSPFARIRPDPAAWQDGRAERDPGKPERGSKGATTVGAGHVAPIHNFAGAEPRKPWGGGLLRPCQLPWRQDTGPLAGRLLRSLGLGPGPPWLLQSEAGRQGVHVKQVLRGWCHQWVSRGGLHRIRGVVLAPRSLQSNVQHRGDSRGWQNQPWFPSHALGLGANTLQQNEPPPPPQLCPKHPPSPLLGPARSFQARTVRDLFLFSCPD